MRVRKLIFINFWKMQNFSVLLLNLGCLMSSWKVSLSTLIVGYIILGGLCCPLQLLCQKFN